MYSPEYWQKKRIVREEAAVLNAASSRDIPSAVTKGVLFPYQLDPVTVMDQERIRVVRINMHIQLKIIPDPDDYLI